MMMMMMMMTIMMMTMTRTRTRTTRTMAMAMVMVGDDDDDDDDDDEGVVISWMLLRLILTGWNRKICKKKKNRSAFARYTVNIRLILLFSVFSPI